MHVVEFVSYGLPIKFPLLALGRERVTFDDCSHCWGPVEICRHMSGRVYFTKTSYRNAPTSLGIRTGHVWWLLGLLGPCWNMLTHEWRFISQKLPIKTSLVALNRERDTFHDCWDYWDYVELCRSACGRVAFPGYVPPSPPSKKVHGWGE